MEEAEEGKEVAAAPAAESPSGAAAAAALRTLRLKKIIKENHGVTIQQIAFNLADPASTNLVATVAATQANIYDNQHCGDNLDLMSHFLNPADEHRQEATLNTCCWMAAASESERDTFLVIGGSDGLIQLLSVARSCVLSHLEGHTDAVINVEAHPTRKGLLLSVGKDSRVFLWDCYPPTLPSRKPLCCFATSALCTCVSSDGRWFLTGEANGALQRWDIPREYLTGASTASSHDQDTTAQLPTSTEHQAIATTHGADIDCIRRVGSYGFASKSVDGRIILWRHDQTSPPTLIEQASIRIAGCNRQVTSRFDVCQEGRFLCAGNAQGAVVLYDLRPTPYPAAGEGRSNGSDKGDISQPQLLTRLEYRRRGNASSGKAAVRCCVFSADCRHVLVAGCEPYVWRWSAPPGITHPPPPGDSKSGTPTNENIEQEEEEEQQEEEEEEQEQEDEEDEEEKNKKPRKKAKLSS